MITKKMKIAVCLLSLTALLSINNVNAGIGRLIFSKPTIFVAGVLAYPWLLKYFFTSPEERARLEQQEAQQNTQANPEGEQNRTQGWAGKLAQVAGNIKENSVLYYQMGKERASEFYNRQQEELMFEPVLQEMNQQGTQPAEENCTCTETSCNPCS